MEELPVVAPHRLEGGEPLALAAAVAYGPGAIVSRTLVRTSGGSLTAFAFDARQELSAHSTSSEAVLHVLEGRAEVHVGPKKVVLEAGQATRLPANVPHAVRAIDRFKMLLAMFRDAG